MNTFRFPEQIGTVVCLGAHPDDIEIGAAGTIALLASQFPMAHFHFVVLTGSEQRQQEARSSAAQLLGERVRVSLGDFTDAFLPYEDPAGAKRFVVSSVGSIRPDLVLAPQMDDGHQDHRFIGDVAGQVFRDCVILRYEIAKYDGGLVPPNVYVHLDRGQVNDKVQHIKNAFPSQHDHPWFADDAFVSLMRVRGIESNAPSGFAEAFVSSKLVLF
jgi:LmbE family N-acetylglucosaminyl deacetylase